MSTVVIVCAGIVAYSITVAIALAITPEAKGPDQDVVKVLTCSLWPMSIAVWLLIWKPIALTTRLLRRRRARGAQIPKATATEKGFTS